MKFRKSLLAAVCAATMGIAAIPMTSQAAVGVYFDTAPPEARVEVAPPPRAGYVWAPGYWDMRGHSHVWNKGHFVRERRGYHYNEPHWTQDNNRWRLDRGGWAKADHQR